MPRSVTSHSWVTRSTGFAERRAQRAEGQQQQIPRDHARRHLMQRIGRDRIGAKGEHRGRGDPGLAAFAVEPMVEQGKRKDGDAAGDEHEARSEEHTSELQSLMRISYAVFCLKKKSDTT